MRPVFHKSRTTFEKIITILVLAYFLAVIIASNINLDIFVYAGFGTYVIIGLIAFFKPNIMFEVLKKENEEYLARNQKKIPLIKRGFRYGGFALAVMGMALTYVFIVYY
jgi:membrane protease YdiL (CAAX protease family)